MILLQYIKVRESFTMSISDKNSEHSPITEDRGDAIHGHQTLVILPFADAEEERLWNELTKDLLSS